MSTSAFGWAGTTISFVYKLPQIYKFYQVKSSKGVSLISYGIQTTSYILYTIHGYIIEDDPIIIMGVISFLLNVILCCQYLYYSRFEKKQIEIKNDASIELK